MKNRIRNSAFSSPLLSAIAVSLFAVAAFSMSSVYDFNENAKFVIDLIFRAITVFFVIYLAKACGFKLFEKPALNFARVALLILGLLVCVNNFPIIGFLTGKAVLKENAVIIRYVIYCAAVGVAEEFVFRGFVMPLIAIKYRNYPHAPFITVLITSAVFSLCHLFNVFSAGILPTLLQVGYTFLTGGLFCAAYLFSENIIFPIILHVVYDLGGLIFSAPFGIAEGKMWDTATVIITAVLGVVATAVFVFSVWNYKRESKA